MDIGWFSDSKARRWSPTGFAGPGTASPRGWASAPSPAASSRRAASTTSSSHRSIRTTRDYTGRSETSYGLHARLVHTGHPSLHGTTWDGDAATLAVEGDVRQAGALAENPCSTVIRTTLDGLDVLIEDEVTNEGHHPTPHMYLYHMNLGAPLLEEGTELVAPILETTWQTPTATTPGEHWEVPAPRAGFLEQAFLHTMAQADDGTVSLGLVNRAGDEPWGLEVRYDGAPSRAPPVALSRCGHVRHRLRADDEVADGRDKDREAGRLIILEPGVAALPDRGPRAAGRPRATTCGRASRCVEGARTA